MKVHCGVVLGLILTATLVGADGPADNIVDKVRAVPAPGIKLSAADQQDLSQGVEQLGKTIAELRGTLKNKPAMLDLLPDVQIYHNAVRYALAYNEIYSAKEIPVAKQLLQQGMDRAAQLRKGEAPWTTATGLVVRGYLSKIDNSVQPYGMVVPATYKGTGFPHRLDLWYHGRGEKLTELSFISGRQKSAGEFTPANTFVLHPYGRYCNANHFAGEIDTIEAVEHARKHYSIDDNRIVVRGFSMGGASVWNFAVHYPGLWAAAAPGAGFSETPLFLRDYQKEKLTPTWYESKLWHVYDCTDYALNLFNCPTVAYSGEKDSQKQAADLMEKAAAAEGIKLVHVIGAGAGHNYTAAAKVEINRRLDSIVAAGRDPLPQEIHFTTWTLRYNHMRWLTIDTMEKHWERARVDAERTPNGAILKTLNVNGLTLSMPPGSPLKNNQPTNVIIDGQELKGSPVMSDRSWTSRFQKKDGKWQLAAPTPTKGEVAMQKSHGLQGPIDDAFMDRFIFVRPTGSSLNAKVDAWVKKEMGHAIEHWRKQFRGEVVQKDDTAVSADDEKTANLILWGDPSGNKYLAKIVDKLPIGWSADAVRTGDKKYGSDQYVPVLISPNPRASHKYVVLNSGFTFREYDYLNNARQVPKLPDWALLDLNQPTTFTAPAGIADAGFFTEQWKYDSARK
jgi:pimeloyl-ACP methyl ester carboxylesterase